MALLVCHLFLTQQNVGLPSLKDTVPDKTLASSYTSVIFTTELQAYLMGSAQLMQQMFTELTLTGDQ